MAEAYVCKVTSVGQITLPKEVRGELELGGEDFVVLEKVGETYFIRKVGAEKATLRKIRAKVKKSGITREKLDELMGEAAKEVWSKTYGKDFRRR